MIKKHKTFTSYREACEFQASMTRRGFETSNKPYDDFLMKLGYPFCGLTSHKYRVTYW